MASYAQGETPFGELRKALARMREHLATLETDLDQYEAEWRELARRHRAEREAAGLSPLYRPPRPDESELPWDMMPTTERDRETRAQASAEDDRKQERAVTARARGKSWRSS